jgi:hypothetical protein
MYFGLISRIGMLFIALTSLLFANDKMRIGTTVDYSEGHYGAPTVTNMMTTNVQAKYIGDTISIRLDLPYLIISGPSNATVSSDATVTLTSVGTQYRESEGIGDAVLSGIYNAYTNSELGLAVDVGVKLKVPTASHRDGLGTGELDESTQFYAYKNLDNVTLMLGAGYKWVGNPQNIHYRNTINGFTGLIYQISNQTSVGTMFDIKQSVYSNLSDQMEITLYGTHKLSTSWHVQIHTYKGLTDMSPIFGLGGMIGYQF